MGYRMAKSYSATAKGKDHATCVERQTLGFKAGRLKAVLVGSSFFRGPSQHLQ
jgi:hypothetical protein